MSIYKRVVDSFGRDPQDDMMVEEMLELALAILKLRRSERHSNDTIEWHNNHHEIKMNLIEEIADVQLMLNQMKYLHDKHDAWKIMMEKKIERLEKRLKKHE